MSSAIQKEGRARVILNDSKKVICEEVMCLGWCKKTFFRKGKNIGDNNVRKCTRCKNKEKKQSGWLKSFSY